MQKDLSGWGITASEGKRGGLYRSPPRNRDELVARLRELREIGWIQTRKQFNDGLVGNTLEDFLGIKENNISLPDAGRYEIKAQRIETGSLSTLIHYDPYPRRPNSVVTHLLGPKYGWAHKKLDEWSFRITMYGNAYTNRGFKIMLDEDTNRLLVEFNPDKVNVSNPSIKEWLSIVVKKGGLNLIPQPYWKLDELKRKVERKLPNIIYVHAKNRQRGEFEEFKYDEATIYEGFNWGRFKKGLSNGEVYVDFDARGGHNHGTKFRIKQGTLQNFYAQKEQIF